MIEILEDSTPKRWDDIVTSFHNYDVYYLSGYVKAFKLNGDGEPLLIYAQYNGTRCIIVVFKRAIETNISDVSLYDLITPYGYGGFLFDGNDNEHNKQIIFNEIFNYLKDANVISLFIRWHPILSNVLQSKNIIESINIGSTIDMQLSDKETIWNNFTSKNRNTIRNAIKKGVIIKQSDSIDLFDTFVNIYNETMLRDNASKYYYFPKDFYTSIARDMKGKYTIFYANLDNQIISMSIIIYANRFMHYHLSGTKSSYRNYNPTNLLLYEAAQWGHSKGFTNFHLGGGVGATEDNLYKFKKAFNRNLSNEFCISKIIINHDIYSRLVNERMLVDKAFDLDSSFFPLYRS